jgi:hypothetical protein
MAPRRSRFPSTLLIFRTVYGVKFANDIEDDLLGLCDKTTNMIYIRTGQSPKERFQTLIHEVIHAFEFEYGFDITSRHIDGGKAHAVVETLEIALSSFLLQNADAMVRLLSVDDATKKGSEL